MAFCHDSFVKASHVTMFNIKEMGKCNQTCAQRRIDPDASALNQVVCVNQLFPVILARRAAIISLGQWWKIDSLKYTATGK